MIIFKGEYSLNENERKELRQVANTACEQAKSYPCKGAQDSIEAVADSESLKLMYYGETGHYEYAQIGGGLGVSLNYVVNQYGKCDREERRKNIPLRDLLGIVYPTLQQEIFQS